MTVTIGFPLDLTTENPVANDFILFSDTSDSDELKRATLAGLVTFLDASYLNVANVTPFTPTADYHPATKKYVDDLVDAQEFWSRYSTTLSPLNAGDNVDLSTGTLACGGATINGVLDIVQDGHTLEFDHDDISQVWQWEMDEPMFSVKGPAGSNFEFHLTPNDYNSYGTRLGFYGHGQGFSLGTNAVNGIEMGGNEDCLGVLFNHNNYDYNHTFRTKMCTTALVIDSNTVAASEKITVGVPHLQVCYNLDTVGGVIASRAKMGMPTSGTSDVAYFGHLDSFSDAVSYALAQLAAGGTLLNAKTGQTITLNIAGVAAVTVNATGTFQTTTFTGIGGAPSATGILCLTQNSDTLMFYGDGSNWYVKPSDGYLYIMTDEGTNTATVLVIKGKGTGSATLELVDGTNANYWSDVSQSDAICQFNFGSAVTGVTFNVSGPQNVDFTIGTKNSATAFVVNSDAVAANELISMSIPVAISGSARATYSDLIVGTTTGDHGIGILAATSGKSNLYFGDALGTAAEYRGIIRYDHSADSMAFFTAANSRVSISSTGDFTHTNSGAGLPLFIVENTNADAAGASMIIQKLSASPADNDILGYFTARGYDSGSNITSYAYFQFASDYVNNGDESGSIKAYVKMDNVNVSFMELDAYTTGLGVGEINFNNNAKDLDFRVESVGNPNMLFVDAGAERVGIGCVPTTAAYGPLIVGTGSGEQVLTIFGSTYSTLYLADALTGTGAYSGFIQYTHATDTMQLGVASTPRFEVTATDFRPAVDNTYYLGKNDDDSPFAWKGVIVKDTTNGKYYRIEVISGVVTATDLTD